MCTCVLRLGCFLLACPVLYFVPPFSFQPFLMFTSEFNERSRSNPLCDFRLGTVATSDHETPLTSCLDKISSTRDNFCRCVLRVDLVQSQPQWIHAADGMSKRAVVITASQIKLLPRNSFTILTVRPEYPASHIDMPRRDTEPLASDVNNTSSQQKNTSHQILRLDAVRFHVDVVVRVVNFLPAVNVGSNFSA